MTVLLFASLTLRELARRRLVAAVAVITLAIAAFTVWGLVRLAHATVDGEPISEPGLRATAAGIVILLAFLFSFVVALGAALVGAPALGESIANGEILALLARPIRRADVVAGRWLGTVVALAIYIAAAGGLELLIVRVTTGYVPPHPGVALAYLAAAGAVTATASVALASRLPALAAGIVAALLFGLAWIGGILQTIGIAIGNDAMADGGTLVALLFPSDALWRGAVYALQPAVFTAAFSTANPDGSIPANPFFVSGPPAPALLAWTCAWFVAVLGGGMAAFRSRDL